MGRQILAMIQGLFVAGYEMIRRSDLLVSVNIGMLLVWNC